MYYPNGQENNWRKKTRPNDEIWIDFIRKKKTGPDDSSLHVPVFVLRQNLDWGFGIEEKTSDFFDILVCYGGTPAYLRRQGRRCQLLNGIPKIWIKRYKISIKLINNESITSELFGCPLRGDPAGRRLRYWVFARMRMICTISSAPYFIVRWMGSRSIKSRRIPCRATISSVPLNTKRILYLRHQLLWNGQN